MKIYFIQQGNDGPIKIGITWDVKKRFDHMKTFSPHPLRILAIINGDSKKERLLHQKFKKEWLQGEWFKSSERLMQFIQTLEKNKTTEIEMDGEKLLAPFDMAEFIKINPNRIMSMVRKGTIPSVKISGMIYFKPSEINRWLHEIERSQNPPQEKERERKVLEFKR